MLEAICTAWLVGIPVLGVLTALLTHKLEQPFIEQCAKDGFKRTAASAIDYYVMVVLCWPLWLAGCVIVMCLRHGRTA